jgi:hypothetical protein
MGNGSTEFDGRVAVMGPGAGATLDDGVTVTVTVGVGIGVTVCREFRTATTTAITTATTTTTAITGISHLFPGFFRDGAPGYGGCGYCCE